MYKVQLTSNLYNDTPNALLIVFLVARASCGNCLYVGQRTFGKSIHFQLINVY
jgi:hypothetical protein